MNADQWTRNMYGETPLEAHRKGYEAGYMYGFIDGLRGKEPDSRTPGKRFSDEDEAE
ncbi:hypothetical protein J2T13_000173 [Paenibacillus sp. DS2015]|uniref:hypothetical protein n=1 Tax=Paenibacillus sp. DS2015 TaxID=3373917 RepID=UPI003D203AD4